MDFAGGCSVFPYSLIYLRMPVMGTFVGAFETNSDVFGTLAHDF